MYEPLLLTSNDDNDTSSEGSVENQNSVGKKRKLTTTSATGKYGEMFMGAEWIVAFHNAEVAGSQTSEAQAKPSLRSETAALVDDALKRLPREDLARLNRFRQRNSPGSSIGLWIAANDFIANLRRLVIKIGSAWYEPAVSYDPNDNLVEISWSRPDRALIVTIEDGAPVTYLKVWGPHIYNDMEEGESPRVEKLIELWHWLYD